MIDKNYSRPLFTHWRSQHPEISKLVAELYDEISADEFGEVFGRSNNQGRCKPKQRLYIIIVDLYAAWCDDPDLSLSFSRDRNAYQPNSRYNEYGVPFSIVKVIDWLERKGYIITTLGNHDHTGYGRSFTSRMSATEILRARFEKLTVHQLSLEQSNTQELIIRKSGREETVNNRYVNYEDTKFTNAQREILQKYNELLSRTFVDIPYLEEPVATWVNSKGEEHKAWINQTDKVVKRIFNENRWDRGGRYFGGFWQKLSSDLRSMLWINDHPTIELDFSAMHPSLLAIKEGITDPEPFYDYDEQVLPEAITQSEQQRKLFKSLFLIIFNTSTKRAAFRAFRNNQTSGSVEKSLSNEQLNKVVSVIISRHPYLKKYFFSRVATSLMFQESQITEVLLKAYTEDDTPILSVHESFIVQVKHAAKLANDMKSASKEVLGSELKFPDEDERLKLHYLSVADPQQYELILEHYYDRSQHTDGYRQRLKAFNSYKQRIIQEW